MMDISVSKSYVRFDVGGYLHMTHMDTLNKFPDSFLAKCVAPEHDKRNDSSEFILIDRDGKHFGAILNYMRHGSLELNRWHPKDIVDLANEADFYGLTELCEMCEPIPSSIISEQDEPDCISIFYKKEKEEKFLEESNKQTLLFSVYAMETYGIDFSYWRSYILPTCATNKYSIYLSDIRGAAGAGCDYIVALFPAGSKKASFKLDRYHFLFNSTDYNQATYVAKLAVFLLMLERKQSETTDRVLSDLNSKKCIFKTLN